MNRYERTFYCRTSQEDVFLQFDEISWYIEHDKCKINSIRRCLKENEKCYLGNLLETAKRYFSGSLRDFQKCGINTVEIKKNGRK